MLGKHPIYTSEQFPIGTSRSFGERDQVRSSAIPAFKQYQVQHEEHAKLNVATVCIRMVVLARSLAVGDTLASSMSAIHHSPPQYRPRTGS